MRAHLRGGHVCALAAVAAVALGGPEPIARALASAAGTAFEAAPFLVFAGALESGFVAGLLPRKLGRICAALVHLGGCGCARGRFPGALSIPALALTILTFGPFVAGARAVAACALVARRRPPIHGGPRASADAFAELETLAACALVSALALAAIGARATTLPWAATLGMGCVLGLLAPCATAGVAIAAAFAHAAPGAAVGVLCTSGLVSVPFARTARAARVRRAIEPAAQTRSVPLTARTLGVALGAIVFCGPSGLVNPRLFVPIAVASALVFARADAWRSASARPALVPLLMCCALVVRPAPPPPSAAATRLDDAFAGERLDFVGIARETAGATTLTRYAITCCRIDATPVSVRLARRLNVADGSWVAARGTLETTVEGTLALRPATARQIAAPADPFVYR